MGRPRNQVSDAELEVLKILWSLGPRTTSEALAALQEAGRRWAYTTVQTLLARLRTKGYVERATIGSASRFVAVVSQDMLIRQSLDSLVDRVCGGSSAPLLLNLARREGITPDELARFRSLLDELEQRSKAGGNESGRPA